MTIKYINDGNGCPILEETLTKEEIEGRLRNLAVRKGFIDMRELVHRVTHGEFEGTVLETKVRMYLHLLGCSTNYVYTDERFTK